MEPLDPSFVRPSFAVVCAVIVIALIIIIIIIIIPAVVAVDGAPRPSPPAPLSRSPVLPPRLPHFAPLAPRVSRLCATGHETSGDDT
ncbi:hypothetical protein O9K51_02192 [Purpureocillium lavendulum]|uniref:Uncharacterized protein n=1 Tax=Purpureocillium lavendulum TaxID=1247861 RepID=A0AB34FYF5_9HYPO|nr:hypothetical protein O9K51_02192 [Purpureocillium lavendulum]